MLYLIFTIDGDWKAYFNRELSEGERAPKKEFMQTLIRNQIEVAARNLDGKFIHFIHASPRARDFFLQKPFIGLWKEIIEKGGDIGIHCHEEEPYQEYYFQDIPRMEGVIKSQADTLRAQGLRVQAYRGGFLAFCKELIPVLERQGLRFDFSCEPGRYLIHNQIIVSDWRNSPVSLYRLSYEDHRKVGDSRVYEIPLGFFNEKYLYFEKSGPKELEEIASGLKEMSASSSHDIIVSVLTHSYEYESEDEVKVIEDKLSILKKYGAFINLKELREITKV